MTNRPISRVAVIGLGNMGIIVARRAVAAFPTAGHDPVDERRALAAPYGIATPGALAATIAGADAVLFSLPNPAISHATLAACVAAGLPAGTLIIETSTVAAADALAMHQAAARAGLIFLDAAIQSGVEIMLRGESMLLVGAEPAALDRAAPVLNALSPHRMVMGPPGAGAAAKVINNAVAHAVYVVLSEAAAMAGAAGIAIPDLVRLLAPPDAGLMRPLTHRIGERLARRDFTPGMPLDAARKDSVLALAEAQRHGIPLFAIQAAHSAYELATAKGLGREDYAALALLWERWLPR